MINPKIRYVSFASDGRRGTKNCVDAQKKQVEKVKSYSIIGKDQFYAYTCNQLDGTPFYQAHSEILSQSYSAGFCLWKPFFILQAMNGLELYDYVLYLDVDIDVTRNPRDFVYNADKCPVVAIESPFNNANYTKRDCLIGMDADKEPYLSIPQLWAAVLAFRADETGRMFVLDWLLSCCNKKLIMNETSGIEEHPGFVVHRHDQSILTILMKRYGFAPLSNTWASPFHHPPF